MSSNAVAHVVRDSQAVRICTLSGIQLIRGRIATLEQLQKSIIFDIQQVEATARRDNIIHLAGFGLRITKVVCDTVFDVIGELGGAPGKLGKGMYKSLDTLADGLGRQMAGEQVNWGQKTAKAVNEGINTLAGHKLEKLKVAEPDLAKGYQIAQKLNKTKTDMVIDMVAEDEKAFKKNAQKYFVDLGKEIGDVVVKAPVKYKKLAKIGWAVTAAGYDSWRIYNEMTDNYLGARELEQRKKPFIASLKRLDALINELKKEADACEREMEPPQQILGGKRAGAAGSRA